MKPARPSKARKRSRSYEINQCALYKVTSPQKLCKVLGLELGQLLAVLDGEGLYKEFPLPEEVNPFSGKKTKARFVQAPCGQLRLVHERILSLLKNVVCPSYAHGAVKGRSYRSNALAHENSKVMATFDLKGFYGATKSHAVSRFFEETLLCAPDVSRIMTRLVTFGGCLPTGSPLSPLLALHISKPMLDSLNKLAVDNGLIFTCYVDDLTFSGDSLPGSLGREVGSIAGVFGYRLSRRKTRFYGEGESKHVTGTVIFSGKVSVPHSRFRTARNIEDAISGRIDRHGFSMQKLMEKLAGVLNEASYLDERFKAKAVLAQVKLNRIKDASLNKKAQWL